jgi:hypothetical protein
MSAPDFPPRSFVLLPFASFLEYLFEDQSFPARFVKGFAGIAAIAGRGGVISVTAILENQALTGSLLAKRPQLWPVSR